MPTPSGTPRVAAPLPLMTQPMIQLDPPFSDDAGQTHVDKPYGMRVDRSELGVATVVTPAMTIPKQTVVLHAQQRPAGPPPEIGLTQHHVPDDALDARLALVIDPDSERSAAFRVLRHHLLELGRPQVIVVSSAVPGDGKTVTAINLALALAECGRAKVLLAETHVRRPQLSNILGLTPPWCFYEQLAAHRHQPMLPWSLVEIPQMWLHVAAINPRIEKTQLLDGPAFAIAMERLRVAYEHIVIDAPPVLGSADVNLMADAADAVILAVRSRRSTARDVRKAVEQLGSNKVVGTVLVT
jgi:Mrp family chromosome partitioning ATPase